MSKTITIPADRGRPFVVIHNGIKYIYEPGETVEVPDGVALEIEEYKRWRTKYYPEDSGSAGGGAGGVTVNVKQFGAKGNGVADDTEAIQKALNHLRDSGGGTVYFPLGTYMLGSVLGDASNSGTAHSIKVYSNSRLLFEKGSVLKRGSADVTHMLFTANASDATGYTGVENIEIVGCIVDANGINNPDAISGNQTPFNLTHATNVVIKDCVFKNLSGKWHCIEINSSRDVIVEHCIFKDNQSNEDIQLDAAISGGNLGKSDGTVCTNITIKNCVFNLANKQVAIGNHANAAHRNIRIHDNLFYGGANASRGYINFVSSTKNVDIYNNTFYDSTYGVVSYALVENCTLHDNRFENCIVPYTGTIVAYNNIVDGLFEGATSGAEEVTIELPEGYTEVKYLASNGAQWIETSYIPTTEASLAVENFDFTITTQYLAAFGSASVDNAADSFNLRSSNQTNYKGKMAYQRGGSSAANQVYTIAETSAELIKITKNGIIMDGTAYGLTGTVKDSVYPFFLFCRNLGGTANAKSTCKIGRFFAKEGTEYALQLVPCTDASGKPCYYDAVSGTTLYNCGTGDDFTYGEAV